MRKQLGLGFAALISAFIIQGTLNAPSLAQYMPKPAPAATIAPAPLSSLPKSAWVNGNAYYTRPAISNLMPGTLTSLEQFHMAVGLLQVAIVLWGGGNILRAVQMWQNPSNEKWMRLTAGIWLVIGAVSLTGVTALRDSQEAQTIMTVDGPRTVSEPPPYFLVGCS